MSYRKNHRQQKTRPVHGCQAPPLLVNRDCSYHRGLALHQVSNCFKISYIFATFDFDNVLKENWYCCLRGSNSVGRVRPCQGRCRGFESRLPLQTFRPEGLIMRFILLFVSLLATAWAQDYKVEVVSGAPSGLPAAYTSAIQTQGYRVTGPNGPWCEIWFRNSVPTSAKPTDDAIVFPIPQGALVGILRFPSEGATAAAKPSRPASTPCAIAIFRSMARIRAWPRSAILCCSRPSPMTPIPPRLPASTNWCRRVPRLPARRTRPCSRSKNRAHAKFPSVTTEGDTPDQVLNVKIGDLQLALIVVGKAQNWAAFFFPNCSSGFSTDAT